MKKFRSLIRSILFERRDVERYEKIKLIVDSLVTQLFDNKREITDALIQRETIDTGYEDIGIVITTESFGSPTRFGGYNNENKTMYFTLFPYISYMIKHDGLEPNVATTKVIDTIFYDKKTFKDKIANKIAHELSHHFDYSEFGLSYKDAEEAFEKRYMSIENKADYLNTNAEYNAFFNQNLYDTIEKFNFIEGSWTDFYKLFIDTFQKEYFNLYNDKNKRKVQKRLYDTFVKLKEKTTSQ